MKNEELKNLLNKYPDDVEICFVEYETGWVYPVDTITYKADIYSAKDTEHKKKLLFSREL